MLVDHSLCQVLFVALAILTVTRTDNEYEEHKSVVPYGEVLANITRINMLLKELVRNYEELKNVQRAVSSERSRSSSYENQNENTRPTRSLYIPTRIFDYDDSESKEPIEKRTTSVPRKIAHKIYHNIHTSPEEEENYDHDSINKGMSLEMIEAVDESFSDEGYKKKNAKTRFIKKGNLRVGSQYDSFENADAWKGRAQPNTDTEDKPIFKEKPDPQKPANDQNVVLGFGIQYNRNTKEGLSDLKINGEAPMRDTNMSFSHDGNKPIAYWIDILKKKLRRLVDMEKILIQPNTRVLSEEDLSNARLTGDTAISIAHQLTHPLRQNTDDVCSKVIVRKCYLAVKEAALENCRHYNCKKGFCDAIKDNSKTNCIIQFTGQLSLSQPKNRAEDKKFVDLTRSGFVSALCLPIILRKNPELQKLRSMKMKQEQNKWEKECQSIAVNKCNNACIVSFSAACDSDTCSESRLSAAKTSCLRQCKKRFMGTGANTKSDSSSDSDSESSSDSDSDSSSDSDSKESRRDRGTLV